jgi:phenylalanyl-tRNA synthetase alpha chain
VYDCRWSDTQLNRLKALGAEAETLTLTFATEAGRDASFQKHAKRLTRQGRERLKQFRDEDRRPHLVRLEHLLAEALVCEGFTQVATPIIMSKGHLGRMGLDRDHDLYRQIFWADANRCFRPMLAPHLYYVSKDLLRLWPRPLRLFEIGPCFRKESHGVQHMNEFTMLNLVEYGTPETQRHRRLEALTGLVMTTAGISDYLIEQEQSEVYGDTMDVMAGSGPLEVASAAMGPHRLDAAWGVTETWVGIGFGLERLTMVARGWDNLKKCGRSLSYLDGIPLNI